MRQPLVSVLLPVHNAAPYLPRCLDSLLSQRLQDWEVVAIDDGSIDSSLSILRDYSRRDSRVRVSSIPQGSPGGEGFPCNRALEQARGLTIARLDADDWFQPEALESLYSALMESDADVAVARYQLVDPADGIHADLGADACWRYLQSLSRDHILETPFDDVLLHLGPVACRNLYRRDFLVRHNIFYPEGNTRSQDHGFHWLCWSHASKATLVNEVLYNYRRGLVGQLTDAYVEQLIESYQQVMDWVVDQLERRGLLLDSVYLLELDMLRQVTGLARQLPPTDARFCLRQLSKHVSQLPRSKARRNHLHAHIKVRYWRWLRFCLLRERPWIGLVDSRLTRLAHALVRRGSGVSP